MAVLTVSCRRAVNIRKTPLSSLQNYLSVYFLLLLLPQIILGEGTAFVEVYNNRKTDGSSFQVVGNFTSIGSVGNADGNLKILPLDCDSNEDRLLYNTQGWIGVFYLTSPSTEYEDLNPDKPCCSLVDRVKEVMLFGASALILLANVDTHIWMQLDVSQLFTKPIIVINETKHIMKFMGFLQKSEKSSLRSKITFDSTFYDLQSPGFDVVGSTCIYSCGVENGGFDGVFVCSLHKDSNNKPHSSWWYILLSTLTLCAFFILLRSPQQFRIPDVEESLQQVAQQVLSKMKTRCYSHKKRRHKHDRGDDTCPICLEKYFPKQMIRVLPCFHEYHVKCVDSWLIQQRTCPLCKLNIIDHNDDSVKIQ